MTDNKHHETHGVPDPNDPIAPIDFTPPEARRRGFRLRLSPARVAVAGMALVFAGAAWFVLTAKSVFIDVSPVGGEISVDHPLALRIGPRYLMWPGAVDVSVRAEGYYDLDTTLDIDERQAQTYQLAMQRLPGFLNLATIPVDGATVRIDGEVVGTTPLERLELTAGEHRVNVERERYQGAQSVVDMEGRSTEQDLQLELVPAWAEVSLRTSPAGASVYVDGEEQGVTPLTTEILQGDHEVLVKLAAHKAWTEELRIIPLEHMELPLIELEAADGLVLLQSSPSNAGVLLDGNYQGQTPLEIAVPPQESHQLTFFRNGYREASRSVRLGPEEEASFDVTLEPITNSVQISATPTDADLYVNGEYMGKADQTVELLAASQEIEIRREGYVPYTTTFMSRPGLEQKLEVDLMTLEQEREANIKPVYTTAAGQTMRLLRPSTFTMGASRREAGRQANEVLRDVSLTRRYYLSTTEVSNVQFKQFDPEHSSGVVEGQRLSLSNNNQPVVRVSWEQAALYCNWLSQREGLPLFYRVEDGKVTGSNADSHGYRLPSEAEWAWAGRVDGEPTSLLKFPWGAELPPPANHGNYADLAAASILGRILSDYNDSYAGSAPVGSFPANPNGMHDMGGNVAEWTHDFYGTSGQLGGAVETDPMGPGDGRYHVIRGSSWAHGSITELRLSYRDYGNEPRDDVGFRIARYLED